MLMCGWSTNRLHPDTPHCCIEMLWVLVICFQRWLSVLTENCSFHLPLTTGQTWWMSKSFLAACSWPGSLVCTKRGGVLHSSQCLMWVLTGRKEFAVNTRIPYSGDGGVRWGTGWKARERKQEHVIGEHSVHFSLGCSEWAVPLGNYAVSWLKGSALEQLQSQVLTLFCRSLGSHDYMCLTVTFKSLSNGTSATEGWNSSAMLGTIVAQILAYRRVQECCYSKYFNNSHYQWKYFHFFILKRDGTAPDLYFFS